MKIPFKKMHGCGNDFVVIDARDAVDKAWKSLAPKLLDRRFGIGGDSLLIVYPSETADARMAVFEKDERESEMCGNGIRCVAEFLRLGKNDGRNNVKIDSQTNLESKPKLVCESILTLTRRPIPTFRQV